MSEANAEDKDQHLEYSDPFQSPTELMGSDTSMRRMFVVQYSCPLCGQEHSCEIYLTLIASNENEMMQKALQTLNRDDVKLKHPGPLHEGIPPTRGRLPATSHSVCQTGNTIPVPGDRGSNDRRR